MDLGMKWLRARWEVVLGLTIIACGVAWNAWYLMAYCTEGLR
jgi:hypothetical protein